MSSNKHSIELPNEIETLENSDIDAFAENFNEFIGVIEARYNCNIEVKEMIDGRDFALVSAEVFAEDEAPATLRVLVDWSREEKPTHFERVQDGCSSARKGQLYSKYKATQIEKEQRNFESAKVELLEQLIGWCE